jgi:hypothetical protein
MQSHKKNKTAQLFLHNAELVPASKYHDLMVKLQRFLISAQQSLWDLMIPGPAYM